MRLLGKLRLALQIVRNILLWLPVHSSTAIANRMQHHAGSKSVLVYFGELAIVWVFFGAGDMVSSWLTSEIGWWSVIVLSTLSSYFLALFVVFNQMWHRNTVEAFGKFDLSGRVDVMRLARMGSKASYVSLLVFLFFVLIDSFKLVPIAPVIRAIPAAAYFVGLYALRFRIPFTSQIDTAFLTIENANNVPSHNQLFSIKLLRDQASAIVRKAYPLIQPDFDKTFNALYCINAFGTTQTKELAKTFLSMLQANMLQRNALDVMNLMDNSAQTLKHSLMDCPLVTLRFKWERLDLWARLERWTFPIIIITGILSFANQPITGAILAALDFVGKHLPH